VLPVEKFARLTAPGLEPASIVYAVGPPPDAGAAHPSVTVEPVADALKDVGADGAGAVPLVVVG
jgi:hypothetical protein